MIDKRYGTDILQKIFVGNISILLFRKLCFRSCFFYLQNLAITLCDQDCDKVRDEICDDGCVFFLSFILICDYENSLLDFKILR